MDTAIKDDAGKAELSLISRDAIEAEGRVLALGARKYSADNWRGGFTWRRLIDAALRHIYALADGEDRDLETGELHTAHARCTLGFLHEHMTRGIGIDDRYRRPTPASAPGVPGAGAAMGVVWGAPAGGTEPFDLKIEEPAAPPKSFSFWYIAAPYSGYSAGRIAAFTLACRVAARFIRAGVPVFSPIAYSHSIQGIASGVLDDTDHEFWMAADRPFMDAASGLVVVMFTGWKTSRGVGHEIARFKAAGKPVVLIEPHKLDEAVDILRAEMVRHVR